jgi:cell fate (sporulation/competence/biofilm development) regulator YlbF (YheA/YmcA/DUF963 family)
MSNSPFSKPPLPAFGGIMGKIEMIKTAKASIEAKKDFVETTKKAVKVKAMQKVNEAKDKALREARERGKSASDTAKKKREEAVAKAKSLRGAAASRTAQLTGTATAAITSARSISSAVSNNPTLNRLKETQSKLGESIAEVQSDITNTEQKISNLEQTGGPATAITEAKQKLTSQQVELRQLAGKKEDIERQIDSALSNITG